MDLSKTAQETQFEWKLRCCLAKLNHQTDLDWIEIVELLGLDISGDHLRKLAYGYQEYYQYLRDESGVKTRILSVSDAHVPFNLPPSIFEKYAGKVDVLIFNGDIEDCQSVSTFPKQYRVGFDHEMELTRQYICQVINMICPKKVIFVLGNHESRLARLLTDRLNDDLLAIMPDSPLELIVNHGFIVKDRQNHSEILYKPLKDIYAEKGIELIYDGNWWTEVGHVIFAHPLSYSSGMLKTTEKAVNYFLRQNREFTSLVLGHTHKIGSYKQGGISMYEQGCCCDLSKLNYADGKLILPNQNGFIYLCLDENGDVIDSKSKLESF